MGFCSIPGMMDDETGPRCRINGSTVLLVGHRTDSLNDSCLARREENRRMTGKRGH